MGQVLPIVAKDIRNGLRDNIIAYSLIAPLLLVIGMKVFWPMLAGTSLTLVAGPGVEPFRLEQITRYASVETASSRERMLERVQDYDDAVGIDKNAGGYQVIVQGDEQHSVRVLPGLILNAVQKGPSPYTFEFTDVLGERPAGWNAMVAFIMLTWPLIGGMVMALSIIEERQFGIIQALQVSPVSRRQYVAGKSLLGVLVTLILILATVLILEIRVNYLQLLLLSLATMFLSVILGFLVGVMSEDQISGIANMKASTLFFIVVPILSLVLAASHHGYLYWAPTYWAFKAYESLIRLGQAPPEFVIWMAWIVLTTLVFFGLSFRFLQQKL